jgi:hypothetical protein
MAYVSMPSSDTSSSETFSYFKDLTDDLQISIVSFVADAPFERSLCHLIEPNADDVAVVCRSTLTHVLPLVSKRFCSYSQQNLLWKNALHRLLQSDKVVWKNGIFYLLRVPNGHNHNSNSPVRDVVVSNNHAVCVESEPSKDDEHESPESLWLLLEQIHDEWRSTGGFTIPGDDNISYLLMFREVVRSYLRWKAPIFYMPGHVQLQETFRLHFFEPRYRFMIAELLMAHPESSRRGGLIPEGHRPAFLYVFDGRPPPIAGKPACLIHVTRCFIYENGTADVECLPVDYVCLERVWIRQERSHLFMGQCRRMSQSWKENVVAQDRLPQRLGLWLERIVGVPFVVLRHDLDEGDVVDGVDRLNQAQSTNRVNDRRF